MVEGFDELLDFSKVAEGVVLGHCDVVLSLLVALLALHASEQQGSVRVGGAAEVAVFFFKDQLEACFNEPVRVFKGFRVLQNSNLTHPLQVEGDEFVLESDLNEASCGVLCLPQSSSSEQTPFAFLLVGGKL